MNRIKCIVSYDGTRFYGFQIQKKLRTVQGEIQKAIHNICKDEDIVIHMVNSRTPCIIKDENESYIYLVLPINFV